MALHPQPVALISAPVTIPANTGAGVVFGFTQALRNTDAVGVLVDRLVFAPSNPLTEFAVRLSYQGETITNGWIPVHAFCWPQNEAWYRGSGPTVVFARPIYLAPGEWIDVSIQVMAADPVANTITVAALGRETADAPVVRTLPYLTSFMGSAVDFTTVTPADDTSSTQDLGNPFTAELHVERLVGLAYTVGTPLAVNPPTPDWNLFKLTVTDQADRFWIPRPTPLPAVFDMPVRSWIVGTIMPAHGYLRARIETTPPGTALAPTYRPVLGLVGYRRIAS